jgi:hypothetical protein
MRIIFPLALLVCGALTTVAQNSRTSASCTQILKLAQTTYEQGRLHEVPKLLEACITRDQLSDEEKRDAFKLLTQAYIYLEEPKEADAHMILLLKADPFFEVDEAVDPAEFITLYRKFRTKPLFRVGAKGAVNATLPVFISNFYVGGNGPGLGNYNAGVGFQGGLVLERDLFQQNKFRNNWKQRLVGAAELMYFARRFTYENNSILSSDLSGGSPGTLSAEVNQVWIDITPLVQYRLGERFGTYVTLGPTLSRRLRVESIPTTNITPNGATPSTLTGTVNQTDALANWAYSVQVGAGAKVRIGKFYVTGEVRYQHGLGNVINSANRSTPEAVFDFAFQNNDFRQNNLALNIGFLVPFFKPKKLIR